MADKDNTLIGKKTEAIPTEHQEIGIDTNNELMDDIISNVEANSLDLSSFENFSNLSQSREQMYMLIDTMAEDDRVSAVLETYAEDVCETNEKGQIMWCESSDEEVGKYVNYLLDALNIDKHAYEWVYSLVKYGDAYLQLFRKDDEEDEIFSNLEERSKLNEKFEKPNELNLDETLEDDTTLENIETTKPSTTLNEDVNIVVSRDDNPYELYLELKENPCTMYELTKKGKTMGYIEAETAVLGAVDNQTNQFRAANYRFNKQDVNIYNATDFVHGALYNNNSMRCPETVCITTTKDDKSETTSTYKVKRGQSLLYNQFKTWRQMSLLENSVLLSRITKSSILRLINLNTLDMPKDKAREFVSRLKNAIEQKSAIEKGKSIQEYTNPGPIANTVIVPVKGEQGRITIETLGNDYDPKNLTDLDFFVDKFYGSMRVPKQFFNLTGDSAGFDGGKSLSIISSRYGKEIKQIQNIFVQMITDAINLILINRGYERYINRFKLKMQAPVTSEELDRRENVRNSMGIISDVMNQVDGVVTDEILKLKIVKALLSSVLSDPEVVGLLQEQIDKLEADNTPKDDDDKDKKNKEEETERPRPSFIDRGPSTSEPRELQPELPSEETTEEEPGLEQPEEGEDTNLPSPSELDIDMTSNL